jgi:hypothetical protein
MMTGALHSPFANTDATSLTVPPGWDTSPAATQNSAVGQEIDEKPDGPFEPVVIIICGCDHEPFV